MILLANLSGCLAFTAYSLETTSALDSSLMGRLLSSESRRKMSKQGNNQSKHSQADRQFTLLLCPVSKQACLSGHGERGDHFHNRFYKVQAGRLLFLWFRFEVWRGFFKSPCFQTNDRLLCVWYIFSL